MTWLEHVGSKVGPSNLHACFGSMACLDEKYKSDSSKASKGWQLPHLKHLSVYIAALWTFDISGTQLEARKTVGSEQPRLNNLP